MKTTSDTRRPYTGSVRSLVCAIDVGTTFSGVSYSILEPGEVPKIFGVTRFPGQEHVAGNCKIPSVLYYDSHGRMMAAGAEAESMASQAEDENWIKVDLFKLRLRPRSMHLNMNGMRLGRLPLGKSPIHVLGDFLAYLFLCTRNFITDTHANGSALWAAVEHDIKFVLSHPNGWEGAQQSKFRRAAIHGGLVPNTSEGKARIYFVTEGEASLHACVLNGLAADVLSDPSKPGFLIADAGGGTWDISAYSITGQNPLQIDEIAPPDCIFAGSVFVSRRARRFLEEKLRNSKYGSAEAVEHITKRFDETTKRLFRDDHSLQFVSFGSPLDKDSSVGIRGGKLKLTGEEVRDLFEPSIEAAFEAIKAQVDASAGVIKSVWLVGGFAANHWLFNQLQERLAPYGVSIHRPDSQTSKAVCDGSVGFYVDHHVSVRMSKAFYGVEYLRTFNPDDEEHVARESSLVELPSGPRLLPDAFDCILKQGIKVKESTVFSRKYSTELTSLNVLSVFEVLIWCYRGKGAVPAWIYRHAEEFSTLCIVRADLSPLKGSAVAQEGKNGTTFWKIIFSIEMHFGLSEFKARIKWVDSEGEVKYGPASIIYNERGRRVEEDEPDMFSEDDMTVVSTHSERVRSPPPALSRPPSTVPVPPRDVPSSPARSAPPEPDRVIEPAAAPAAEPVVAPAADPEREASVPDVARLPEEQPVPKSDADSRSSRRGASPSPPPAAPPAAPASVSQATDDGEREPFRGRKSGKGKNKGKDKAKHKEEEKKPTPEASVMSRTSSKLGEELSSVWGQEESAASKAGSRRSRSRAVDAPETVVEEVLREEPPLSATPKAATPKLPSPVMANVEPPPVEQSKSPTVAEKGLEGVAQVVTDTVVEKVTEEQPAPPDELEYFDEPTRKEVAQDAAGGTSKDETAASEPNQGVVQAAEAEKVTEPEQTQQPEVVTSANRPVTPTPAEPATADVNISEVVPPTADGATSTTSQDVVSDATEKTPTPTAASPAKSAHHLPTPAAPKDDQSQKSAATSRKVSPHGTPVAPAKGLSDLLTTSLAPSKLTPGLQHLALPEQIPLPLSTTGSPKTPLRSHGSPLSAYDNNVWASEANLAGDGLLRATSRAPSALASPISKPSTLGLGFGEGEEDSGAATAGRKEGGSTSTTGGRKGRRSAGGTPKRSRQASGATAADIK
ncbi:hypothetical protein MKEN_00345500 [Mycena kentingensis (nom. inval.)]|nr:hypothetical protein MKEN_00345500 [Mycena kentingensis (nom. inval.)]